MKRCYVLALSALVFITAARADDLKAMEGTWTVEKMEIDGKAIEPEGIKSLVVKITGDRYEVTTKDGTDAGTLKLDETQTPKTMDATDTEGEDIGKVIKAIYELKGDTLKVCYATNGGARPTELASKEGSSALLATYTREKAAK